MDFNQYNTSERKNKHLNEYERGQIEALHHEGFSANSITKRLGRSCSTITHEIKRGSVEQIKHNKKKVLIYYADFTQRQYEKNRALYGRKFKLAHQPKLFLLADQLMKEKKYAPDVGVGLINRQFPTIDFACPKTLYNDIDLGLLQTKPTKVKRKEKKTVSRRNKRVLGTSIEQR